MASLFVFIIELMGRHVICDAVVSAWTDKFFFDCLDRQTSKNRAKNLIVDIDAFRRRRVNLLRRIT